MRAILTLFIIIAGINSANAKAVKEYENRFKKPNIAKQLYDFKKYANLDSYSLKYRRYIRLLRPDLTKDQIEKMTPLTKKVAKGNCITMQGILMVHGLTDSPFYLSDLRDSIEKKQECVIVKSVILPGHGLIPGALLEVNYKDWIAAVNLAIKDFQQENISSVSGIGYSTGGALLLNQVLNNNTNIKKIVLLSPALGLGLNFIVRAGLTIMNFIGDMFNSFAYTEKHADINPYKYDSFSFHAAYEVQNLINVNHKLLKKYSGTLPQVYVAFSNEDATISTQATIDFINHPAVKTVSGVIYTTTELPNLAKKNIKVIKVEQPEKRIISSSHIGIPISKANKLYGEAGKINYGCLHYDKKSTKNLYTKCLNKESEVYYGEKLSKYLKQYKIVARITYNSYFKELDNDINAFLKNNN